MHFVDDGPRGFTPDYLRGGFAEVTARVAVDMGEETLTRFCGRPRLEYFDLLLNHILRSI